jgi:hypothetical protein
MHLLNLGNHEHILKALLYHLREWLDSWEFFSMEEVNAVFARFRPLLQSMDAGKGGLSFNDWNSGWLMRVYECQKQGGRPDRLKGHEMESLLLVRKY